jgi:hypothetical protein
MNVVCVDEKCQENLNDLMQTFPDLFHLDNDDDYRFFSLL